MFNAERNETYGVATEDPIEWTLTTKGFLSDGCSNPITLNGGFGNDTFDVLRNRCFLDLNGNSGNDNFVVRSFAALPLNEEGVVMEEERMGVKVRVCNETLSMNGTTTDIGDYTCGDNEISVEDPNPNLDDDDDDETSEEPPLLPDYLVNSLVDVDGGTGSDRLTIVGTEFNDKYVVQDGLVFGGGLTIKFTNINFVDVTGQEGNDEIYVLSTNPSFLLSLYGALGSDTFVVAPSSIEPVTSKNLRGHRGIIEHDIKSNDTDYDGLKIRGIQCNILDNDGAYGYVNVVNQGGFYVMDEDGVGTFSFFIYPTTLPTGNVTVNIVAPAAPDENTYILVNNKTATVLGFEAGDLTPQEVKVTYNENVTKLDITDINLLIKIEVLQITTTDERFSLTNQTLLPIDIKLIPGMDNDAGAKSITIEEGLAGTAVMEGGFNASYDVTLRPCSDELIRDVVVTLEESVPGQLNLSTRELNGTDFDKNSCTATVDVSAYDDNFSEGDHYVNIRHVVTNRTAGEDPIFLTDGSPLYAPNVLVQIYDNDIGGVVIRETNGITALAEMNETMNSGVPLDYYEDDYSLQLTRQPANGTTVEIDILSIAVKTEVANSIFTPSYRNMTARPQVKAYFKDTEVSKVIITNATLTIVGTAEEQIGILENWFDEVPLRVKAIDDDEEEGVDLLNFASQPSNLVSKARFPIKPLLHFIYSLLGFLLLST